MLVVDTLIYAVLMNVLYVILLGNLGHPIAMPRIIPNFLWGRQLDSQ